MAQSSFHVPVAGVFRCVFETSDRSYERVASSLNVGDISVAELAIPERLSDGGYVNPEAALLDGDVPPDVIDQLLLSDDLAWTFSKIDQNIERPTAKGKRDTRYWKAQTDRISAFYAPWLKHPASQLPSSTAHYNVK